MSRTREHHAWGGDGTQRARNVSRRYDKAVGRLWGQALLMTLKKSGTTMLQPTLAVQ